MIDRSFVISLVMSVARALAFRAHAASRAIERRARAPSTGRAFRASDVTCGRKAAKIAAKKGKTDAARTKLYGRFGKLIVQTVKQGGGADPVANVALGRLLKQAQNANVPRDLIERNLKKAAEGKTSDFFELTYEVYGAGGVGIICEVLTDSVNRAAGETRAAATKAGGKMAEPGSVMFNFNRRGVCVINGGTEDEVFEAAMEAGAEDIKPRDDDEPGWDVVCQLEDFAGVQEALEKAGLSVNEEETGLKYLPVAEVETSDEDAAINEKIMDALLALDDVDAVCSNEA